MHQPPKFTYNGLTIVMSNPSRFDLERKELLSANSGLWFRNECLRPELNIYGCDVRTIDSCPSSFLPNTKCLLLLGESSFKQYAKEEYQKNTLNEQRGCPLKTKVGIPAIASYLPQDAFDPIDYETKYNPTLQQEATYEREDEDEEEEAIKDHGKTRRKNYRFWLRRDTKRAIQISKQGVTNHLSPRYHIFPSIEQVCHILRETKNSTLYLDIECEINTFNLYCIGFSFGLPDIFVVPIHLFNGSSAYSQYFKIFQALSIAMRDNETVVHNSQFDLFVLCHRYRIPFGRRIYDTMKAHHKCFVGIEKSLGHAMSHLTWLPYHKDEGIYCPQNPSQEHKLWTYNGKDVYGMILVKKGLDKFALTRPGLTSSIQSTNRCLYPYLLNTMVGMRYDNKKLHAIIHENDRKMMQYLRGIKILTGGIDVLPTSNKQCVEYFHELMDYPVIKRSAKTKKPSLGEGQLYKLKLKLKDQKIFNPVLDIVIAYRRLQKQTGILGFNPWVEPPLENE